MLLYFERRRFEQGSQRGFEQGTWRGFEQGPRRGFEQGPRQGFEQGAPAIDKTTAKILDDDPSENKDSEIA